MADSTGQSQDPNWKLRHQLEQATGAMREAGVVLWAYFDGLVKAGFSEDAALKLTASYARALFCQKTDQADD